MRHNKKHGLKLGSSAEHTRAMKRSLVCSLFLNDRIKTTETRAKAIRGDVDRVITWAKRGDLHSRRLALAKLNDKEVVREVFEKVDQGMWADRTCGFTRIYKLGPRRGDNAPMVLIELVTEPCMPKQKKGASDAAAVATATVVEEEKKTTKKSSSKKSSSKKTEEPAIEEAEAQEVSDEAAEAVPEEPETDSPAAEEPEAAKPAEAAEEPAAEDAPETDKPEA